MTLTKTWLIACALVATPAIAMAEGEGEAGGEVGGEGEGGGEGTMDATQEGGGDAGGGDAGGGGAMDAAGGGATGGAYPSIIIDRPATLTKGLLRATGEVGIGKTLTVDTTNGTTSSSLGIGLNVGADYGISDKIEAGLSYGISLKEFEAKGPLVLRGRFNAKSDEKMRLGPEVSLGYGLDSEAFLIGAGAYFQYNLTPQMALYTPGNQLQFAIADAANIGFLNLPFGFGYQIDPTIFGFVETNLLSLGFADASGEAFIFADFIPLNVGAFYTTGSIIDIGASIGSPDVPDIADNFQFLITARYHKLP